MPIVCRVASAVAASASWPFTAAESTFEPSLLAVKPTVPVAVPVSGAPRVRPSLRLRPSPRLRPSLILSFLIYSEGAALNYPSRFLFQIFSNND